MIILHNFVRIYNNQLKLQTFFPNWHKLKKSVSQKGAKCFCWQLYLVTAVYSLCFNENEVNFLLCLDSTDVQLCFIKLEISDKFDTEEETESNPRNKITRMCFQIWWICSHSAIFNLSDLQVTKQYFFFYCIVCFTQLYALPLMWDSVYSI